MIKLNLADCIGKKYGRLTIVSFAPKRKFNKTRFIVKCDCGNIKDVLHAVLLNGTTKSCGCRRYEFRKRKSKHGMCDTALYKRWTTIKTRCLNPNFTFYKYYGGKGVTICDEWKNDFMTFYNWAINNGYNRELEIDRYPNKDGNYEPSNCRFVTPSINGLNKRNNICVDINGKIGRLSAC